MGRREGVECPRCDDLMVVGGLHGEEPARANGDQGRVPSAHAPRGVGAAGRLRARPSTDECAGEHHGPDAEVHQAVPPRVGLLMHGGARPK